MSTARISIATTAVVVIALLGSPAFADDQPGHCDIEVVDGGLNCIDDDGQLHWDIHHPALWGDQQDYRQGGEALTPIAPVDVAGDTYYAVRRDLLKIDARTGVVEQRVRFPAPITELDAHGDGAELNVTVRDHFEEFPDDDGIGESVTIRHRPGDPSPPQYIWSAPRSKDLFLTDRDAHWLARAADNPDQALQLLEQARSADPTNPFLSLVLGELLADQGDDDAAQNAFEDAAEAPAVWRDLLAVSSRLETAGASDEADLAFQRGLELMEDAGISRQRLHSLIPVVTSLMMPTGEDSPIHQGLLDGDPEQVDRLISRFARLAPLVESGSYNWEALANWMELQGEEGLADKWQQLADENRNYAYDVYTRSVVQVDRALLALIGLTITLVILALLIGMRGGMARRRLNQAEEGPTRPDWLPRVRIRDLLAPALMFVAACAIPFVINTHADVVDKLGNIPVAAGQDGLAAPQAMAWLENLSDSADLDQVLTTATREMEAVQRGEPVADKQPMIHHLIEALYKDARHTQLELLRQGRMPDFIATARAAQNDPSAFRSPRSVSLGFTLIPLGGLVLFALIGSFIGARATRFSRSVLMIVPGGGFRLPFLGAVALLALVAAVGAHIGLDSLIYRMTQPQFLEYFGLQSLEHLAPTPSRLWAWITLGAVVIFQGLFIWQLRQDGS